MAELISKLYRRFLRLRLYFRLFLKNRRIRSEVAADGKGLPVVFFNASTRLEGMSLNAAYSLVSSWGIQMAGRNVYHFTCKAGMSHCVLGAGLGDPTSPPPCKGCIRETRWFTSSASRIWFDYQEDPKLRKELQDLSVSEMKGYSYQGKPLGDLVLPSLRWILRRYHLQEDQVTRYLFSEFILSANNILEKFNQLVKEVDPEIIVIFNGLQYPEAAVRWAAQDAGLRVITHEVNLQPFSAFFTDGEATIYPMKIPAELKLNDHQNQILDSYLNLRFQGDFKMAGVKFWSDMHQLPEEFLGIIKNYNHLVPVFTNVIFDTSQAHANTLFPHMFAWLDLVLDTANDYPDTLFVIRAHPDEMRKGKSSQESVLDWAADKNAAGFDNVLLIGPDETLSSYELIQRSKFALVYNSSIGLEAILLGTPVLCAGKARYTQYPIVTYPESREEYLETLSTFLNAEGINVPDIHYENARKFLYYQLFRTSLGFEEFLIEHPTPGYVQLRDFHWKKLLPGGSNVLDCIVDGILNRGDFILERDL
jgi:hypothetical protein